MSARRAKKARRSPYRSEARKSPALQRKLKRLGARIRELRGDVSQEQAATRAKLDPKHWQAIEGGRVNTTVASLAGIAKALGVSISDLFLGV